MNGAKFFIVAIAMSVASSAAAADIISSDTSSDAAVPVVIRDVSMTSDGTVSAVVVNRTHHIVRDPSVMIQYQWLWANERHPGTDNPGFADTVTLRGDIAPGASMPFHHVPEPGLPDRRDGRFEANPRVVGFTEIWAPGTVSSSMTSPPRRAAASEPSTIISDSRDERAAVAVRGLAMARDGTVTGVVVNRTEHPVRDPELLVQFAWLWADEFHPGVESPGWTDTVMLRGEIPPGGALRFTHVPATGLPDRTDGYFEPEASVLSYTEVMPPSVSAIDY